MFNRRDFLKSSSLIALGSTIPEFLARTAYAAEPGKDNILVVLEMTGGNDGLNTVIPFADERYYKLRPTLGIKKTEVRKVNDSIGLHPRLNSLANLLQNQMLAVVVGVGYPNPDRSHFESMDRWQLGDPGRQQKTGWLARAAGGMNSKEGGFLGMQVGPGKLPLALTGGAGAISLGDANAFDLVLTGNEKNQKDRRKLIEDLSAPMGKDGEGVGEDLTAFVQKRQAQTLKAIEKIKEAMNAPQPAPGGTNLPPVLPNVAFRPIGNEPLAQKLQLVANLINKGLGTRIFYVTIDGFDTHSGQAEPHGNLLADVGNSIEMFFNALAEGEKKRVLLMTFSEFGRRAKENGSKGTDHGAASSLFVAGPAVKSGQVGKYPGLGDLDDGDLKFTMDFRKLYATLLDQWLSVDSRAVLGAKFDHVELLATKNE
jgi:uncharacterized protein (DUF1501 family)